jgi:hypothetical protein
MDAGIMDFNVIHVIMIESGEHGQRVILPL